MSESWCSPEPSTKQALRAPFFRTRIRAPGEFFFGEAFGGFFLSAVVENDVAEAVHAFDAGDVRLLIGIDVVDLEVRGEVLVAVQHVAGAFVGIGLIEVINLDRLLEIADDLLRLIGEGEPLVRGDVHGLVVIFGEPVGGEDHGEDDQNIDGDVGAVLGLPGFNPFS